MSEASQREEEEALEQRRLESLRFAFGPQVMEGLADGDVVEIMLNDDGALWFEKFGSMVRVGKVSKEDAWVILSSVATALPDNEPLSRQNPFVEGELPLDGSRFEGVAPPVTEFPIFAIRKKPNRIYTLDDYVRAKILTFVQAERLRRAIVDKKNILVGGGTGSGKTTFCNALLHEMSLLCPDVRVIIIEDTRELQCSLANKVILRATQWTDMARIAGAVNRLRPDRVSVGEVRFGGPCLSLLKLWNTGHPGGMATVHANNAYSCLTRVDQLIQEVSANPQRLLIGEAVDIVVFLKRSGPPRGRHVEEILSVEGYDPLTEKYVVETVL